VSERLYDFAAEVHAGPPALHWLRVWDDAEIES